MACVAEFGIIEEIDLIEKYGYDREKYNCISVWDDYLDDWWDQLILMKTFYHSFSRPEFGLARFGITFIPPESLIIFIDVLMADKRTKHSEELCDLLALLVSAQRNKKHVIHFGV